MGRYRLLCDEGHKFRGERVGHLHFKKLILNNNYICNNKTQIHCINKTNKQVTSRGPWKIIRNWQCHVSSCVWDSSWKKKHHIPSRHHFPCIPSMWRCLNWTKLCMTSPIEGRKASPVWQNLSAAFPPRDQFVTTGQLYSMPLTRRPNCPLEHYWDVPPKICV